MKIKELVHEAEEGKHDSLLLLLDFLLNEKKSISFDDDIKVLDIYFLPKHTEKINKLLGEYLPKRKWMIEGEEE